MKYILIIVILLFSFDICFSKDHSLDKNSTHAKLVLSPVIGVTTLFVSSSDFGEDFYAEYKIGGNMYFRPIKYFNIGSGFYYHQGTKNTEYFSIPISLNLYTSYSDYSRGFIINPILFFDTIDNVIGLNNPKIGFKIGFGSEYASIGFIYNPMFPTFQRGSSKGPNYSISFAISLGYCFRLI